MWSALSIVYVLWGGTYVAIRVMVEDIPPLLGAGARFAIAGVAMLVFLAALDSARALLGDVLVAESGGVVRAAYSVDERRAIADPFVPTAGLVTLLETRAAPLREARPKRNRGPSAVMRALPARP